MSIEPSVQEPPVGVAIAEEPDAAALLRGHAVVVAFQVRSAPPAGFDAFRPHASRHGMLRPLEAKRDGRPLRNDRGGCDFERAL